MDDEIDPLLVRVRADTQGFARDVAGMRAALEDGLGESAERAGAKIESALTRAVRTGRFGFDDLRRVALSALEDIAASALRTGLGSLFGGDGGRGLLNLGAALLGLPGRATGGPVAPGRAYVVGERGPEVFVPTASGMVAPGVRGGGRDVRVSIAINAPAGSAPGVLERSSRQVARAVRAALAED